MQMISKQGKPFSASQNKQVRKAWVQHLSNQCCDALNRMVFIRAEISVSRELYGWLMIFPCWSHDPCRHKHSSSEEDSKPTSWFSKRTPLTPDHHSPLCFAKIQIMFICVKIEIDKTNWPVTQNDGVYRENKIQLRQARWSNPLLINIWKQKLANLRIFKSHTRW